MMNQKKCIAIARDVLEQLRLKRYEATPGTYIQLDSEKVTDAVCDGFLPEEERDKILNSSFQNFFKQEKGTKCEVCALGSAFVSLVNIENKCSVGEMVDMDGSEEMFDRLERYFGPNNLSLMETAFERVHCYNYANTDLEIDMYDAAIEWGKQYQNPNERLRYIMLNIIRNSGDFKIPQKFIARARSL